MFSSKGCDDTINGLMLRKEDEINIMISEDSMIVML